MPTTALELKLPTVVAAADWSVNHRKRWLAKAIWDTEAKRYAVYASERVGDSATLPNRLQEDLPAKATTVLGLDLPIGLPAEYAEKVGVASFLDFLPQIGTKPWADFATPSNSPTLEQPFGPHYVRRKGEFTRQNLVDGLQMKHFEDTYRRCDQEAQAHSLFLTIGGKQVGRAALHAWQNVLIPNLDHLHIWPFQGSFRKLIAESGTTVIVEVYPGGAYAQLGIGLGRGQVEKGRRRSKTRREDRQHPDVGGRLLAALEEVAHVTPAARTEILSGFDSDDAFDAMVGLAALLMGVTGRWKDETPTDDTVRNVEGWIWRL